MFLIKLEGERPVAIEADKLKPFEAVRVSRSLCCRERFESRRRFDKCIAKGLPKESPWSDHFERRGSVTCVGDSLRIKCGPAVQ